MNMMNPTRRGFLIGTGAVGLSSLWGTTALSSIDPNTHTNRVFHATHWGPLEAVVRDGRIVNVSPMIELDSRPTEMLTMGVVDRVYSKTRIDYPMVRKSYLDGWQSGDTKRELRGEEEYVRVDWDTALNLASKAILDTIDKGGNEAIFSSSSGGSLPRAFATSARVLPWSGLSFSDRNPVKRTRSAEPAARYRFSHSFVGVDICSTTWRRMSGSCNRPAQAS